MTSPVTQLIETVYRHTKGGSYRRLNYALQNALSLAVHAGFRFEPEDFHEISSRFKGGYWCTNDYSEGLYSSACLEDNISAALSYEAWVGRKPFVLGGSRLYVGREIDRRLLGIPWEQPYYSARVTSFSDKNDAVNFHVCNGTLRGRHVRLTYDKVRELEKQRKAASRAASDIKLLEQIMKQPEGEDHDTE
jgi:hypothetical protein